MLAKGRYSSDNGRIHIHPSIGERYSIKVLHRKTLGSSAFGYRHPQRSACRSETHPLTFFQAMPAWLWPWVPCPHTAPSLLLHSTRSYIRGHRQPIHANGASRLLHWLRSRRHLPWRSVCQIPRRMHPKPHPHRGARTYHRIHPPDDAISRRRPGSCQGHFPTRYLEPVRRCTRSRCSWYYDRVSRAKRNCLWR